MTLRFEVSDHGGIFLESGTTAPRIFLFWHNRIVAATSVWAKNNHWKRPLAVLTSASHDGTMLESIMKVFEIDAVRGSSSRRGAVAFLEMKKALSNGFSMCITPDGPRGPRYQLHPGAIKLAQSSSVPIVPIHLTFSSALRLNSWDRFVLPCPFSLVKVTFDLPVSIPAELSAEEFERYRDQIQKTLVDGVDDA